MTCSVVTEKPGVPVSEMQDGDLAVIVDWPTLEKLIGKVVQRMGNTRVVVLGTDRRGDYPNGTSGDLRVRILHPGDTIRID